MRQSCKPEVGMMIHAIRIYLRLPAVCGFLTALFLACAGPGAVAAEINFVQITDPHLFEKAETARAEEPLNFAALHEAVAAINSAGAVRKCYGGKEESNHSKYDFVAVTGDIGVENL